MSRGERTPRHMTIQGTDVGYRKGDRVTANQQLFGMNVPIVAPGATGTVVKTTLLGYPKVVAFTAFDGSG
jgi:hypothetical protein